MTKKIPEMLCIGESDSCAGTGIQADIKVAQAYNIYTTTVISAVSIQNTQGVYGIHHIPSDIVRSQIGAVLADFELDVIKIGMLPDEDVINVIGDVLDRLDRETPELKVIIDPVIASKTGWPLTDKLGRDALKRRLLIHAEVLTPNIREAQELTGVEIKDVDDMKHAAEMLMTLGPQTVILTGGAKETDVIYDIFVDHSGLEIFETPRIESRSILGTGTTLATSVACSMAKGMSAKEAYKEAKIFLNGAIKYAKLLGKGYGPLNHSFMCDYHIKEL